MEKPSSKQAFPDGVGRVGLFWMFRGKAVGAIFRLREAVEVDGILGPDCDHQQAWVYLQEVFPQFVGMEYFQIPRGRVLFDSGIKRFIVFSAPRLLKNEEAIEELAWAFQLPNDSPLVLVDAPMYEDPRILDWEANLPRKGFPKKTVK